MPASPVRLRPLLLVGAALGASSLLAACASTPTARVAGLRSTADAGEPAAQIAPAVQGEDASPYGLFLAGESALDHGDSVDAARFLGKASEISPEAYIRERAFTAAVIAGEISRAASITLVPGEGSIAAERLSRLVRAVEDLATGKAQQALATLKSQPAEGQTAQAVQLLTPCAAAAAGDWTTALAPPAAAQGTPQLTTVFANYNRARLLERAGRIEEADAAYKSLASNADNIVFVLGYGGFLERRNRRPEAIALYDRTLAKTQDTEVIEARDRAAAGRPAPAQVTLQEGAGEALLPPAATLVARRQPELGLAMMRLALRLHPKLDDAWIAVGDSMAAAGDGDAARRAYAEVPPTSSKYPAAETRLAWSLQKDGRADEALGLARTWLERSGEAPDAVSLYADLLRENGRYDEAIPYLDRLIAHPPPGAEPWRLYFLRGVAFERSDRWEKAEPDLREALKLNPSDPEIMNYLGFGWANRDQHLDEALGLLQKAVLGRPRSGEIRDSLGWAEYRLGRYPEAVRDLERAVQLAPAEPDIYDHLGDAYWRVGRKLEAQFQWRRVLSLHPDDKLRAAAEAKLERGLGPGGPSPAAVAAAATAPPRP
jgi:tetratricopeptide (TPR) repeat protein